MRAADAPPIKLGQIEDSSGNFAAAGEPKVHGVALAVDEINAKGGLLGRKIEVIYYDSQSDNLRYQEFARRAIQQDKVDVLFAGFTSASREAVRPIVDRYKQLYFYTNEYEGGLCDKNVFVTGVVPEQILSPFLPWLMDKFGKRVYTIAADYNFGQISAEWIRKIVKENHGEIIGQEFIPLAVSQFSQTISNIQAAKPDVLVTLMIGANQSSFFEQAAAAQLKTPMASFVNGPVFYEHKVLSRRRSTTCTLRLTTWKSSTRRQIMPSYRSGAPNFQMRSTSIRSARTPIWACFFTPRRSRWRRRRSRRRSPRPWRAGVSASTRRRATCAWNPRAIISRTAFR